MTDDARVVVEGERRGAADAARWGVLQATRYEASSLLTVESERFMTSYTVAAKVDTPRQFSDAFVVLR